MDRLPIGTGMPSAGVCALSFVSWLNIRNISAEEKLIIVPICTSLDARDCMDS